MNFEFLVARFFIWHCKVRKTYPTIDHFTRFLAYFKKLSQPVLNLLEVAGKDTVLFIYLFSYFFNFLSFFFVKCL